MSIPIRPEVERRGLLFKSAQVAVSSRDIKVSVVGKKNPFRRFGNRSATTYSIFVENGDGQLRMHGDKLKISNLAEREPENKRFLIMRGMLEIAAALKDDSFFLHNCREAESLRKKC